MKGATGVAIRTGTQIAKVGCELIQLKSALAEAAREPLVAGRKIIRRGHFLAEDWRDEITLEIRKQPFKAIGIALGAGLGLGLLIGIIGRRN